MKHHIITSADGSTSLQLEQFDEAYHSINGAFTEAQHIYIDNCLEKLSSIENLTIFDVGFGSALNAILSLAWHISRRDGSGDILYCGIEKYPIQLSEIEQFNYCDKISEYYNIPLNKLRELFIKIHHSPWEEVCEISTNFKLIKNRCDISDLKDEFYINRMINGGLAAIFYDTFSPATQPELWAEEIFVEIANGTPEGSILSTYCCKGIVKERLRKAGFNVSRVAGPPGKRHIIMAVK